MYFVEEESLDGTHWSTIGAGFGSTATSFTATGPFSASTTYYFRVRAYGPSASYSTYATASVLTPAVPDAPTLSTAVAQSDTAVALTWTAVASATGYRVERQVDGTWTSVGTTDTGVTTFTDTGLQEGTSYSYRVVAAGSFGDSDPSGTLDFLTQPAAPEAPTGLTATLGSGGEMNLSWTGHTSTVTVYYVEQSTDGTTWTQIGSTSGTTAMTYTTTGPFDGSTTYDFRVRAYAYPGGYSTGATTSTTTPALPGQPILQPIDAESETDTSVNLSWADVDGETGYRIERQVGGIWTSIGTTGADVTTFTDTGLRESTAYYYRVISTSDLGDSVPSDVGFVATLSSAPTAPTVSVVSGGQIDLSWTDHSTTVERYWIEQSTDGTNWSTSGTFRWTSGTIEPVIEPLDPTATSFTATGPFNGATTYYFRVHTEHYIGYDSISATTSTTTPAFPSQPILGLVTGSDETDTSASLSWTDAAGETGYRIERQFGGTGAWTSVGTTGAGVTTFTDTGLQESTWYNYRVIATNSFGDSAPSTPIYVLTRPSTGTGLIVAHDQYVDATHGFLSYIGMIYDGDAPVTGTEIESGGLFNWDGYIYLFVAPLNQPAHGQVFLADSTNLPSYDNTPFPTMGHALRYKPDPEYLGPDGFDYVVSDAEGHSSTAHVYITVGLAYSLTVETLEVPDADTTTATVAANLSVSNWDPVSNYDPVFFDFPTVGRWSSSEVAGYVPDETDPGGHFGPDTVVEWRVESPEGVVQIYHTTVDEDSSVLQFSTSDHAGDRYKITASITDASLGDGDLIHLTPELLGHPYPSDDPWDAQNVGIGYRDDYGNPSPYHSVVVQTGRTAQIVFEDESASLPADGRSATTVTAFAFDRAGNPVEDWLDVDWELDGDGVLSGTDDSYTDSAYGAAVTFQAGVYPGEQTVSATIDGFTAETTIDTLAPIVRLEVTYGNVLTLGTDEQVMVMADVRDANGKPVADGTPITWITPKGSFASYDTVVRGGQAFATIWGMGGSQNPGAGKIRAFVGNSVGEVGYLWVKPSQQPSIILDHVLLAGNRTQSGSISIDQVDGTSKAYDFHAQTQGTIVGGVPGSLVEVSIPPNLRPTVSINGQSDPVDVRIGADGRATFTLASWGILPEHRGGTIPVQIRVWSGTRWSDPTTGANVALMSDRMIAKTQDLVGKMAWGAIAGDGNSTEEIAGDLAFSMIPVIGVYSDVRDMAKELFKLAPGGEDPDWFVVGLATAGILAEFTPADLLLDVTKVLAKQVSRNGQLIKQVVLKVKDLGARAIAAGDGAIGPVAKEISDLGDFLVKLINPGDAPQLVGFAQFADTEIVKSAEDFRILQAMSEAVGDWFKDLATWSQQFGPKNAKRINLFAGQLSAAEREVIAEAGKLDAVARGIAKGGWQSAQARQYADLLTSPKATQELVDAIDEFAHVPGSGKFASKVLTDTDGTAIDAVLGELAVAKKVEGEGLTQFGAKPLGVDGDIDVVTETRVYEVKAGTPASLDTVGGKFEDQLRRLVAYGESNGNKSPVLMFKAEYLPDLDGPSKIVRDLASKHGVVIEFY